MNVKSIKGQDDFVEVIYALIDYKGNTALLKRFVKEYAEVFKKGDK